MPQIVKVTTNELRLGDEGELFVHRKCMNKLYDKYGIVRLIRSEDKFDDEKDYLGITDSGCRLKVEIKTQIRYVAMASFGIERWHKRNLIKCTSADILLIVEVPQKEDLSGMINVWDVVHNKARTGDHRGFSYTAGDVHRYGWLIKDMELLQAVHDPEAASAMKSFCTSDLYKT